MHRDAAERAARESRGRLLAILAKRCGDLARAEDALADAFLSALTAWPQTGVPANPDAWLLTAARRRLIDAGRHDQVQRAAQATLALADAVAPPTDPSPRLPDERLELLFACAHPAVDAAARTPLVLQAVLGLSAERIASAFVVAPAAMAQRLVRAKRKLQEANVRFEVPDADQLASRLDGVLSAIYAAFTAGWDAAPGDAAGELADESLRLAELTCDLLPSEPECHGLLSLLMHCAARRAARRGPQGQYVPLSEQDPRHWDAGLIEQAEARLRRAMEAGRLGRFQVEAAIQSAHAERRARGQVNWPAVVTLYDVLVQRWPTLGAQVARVAALAQAAGPAVALAELERLETLAAAQLKAYQPAWALRGRLLADLGQAEPAQRAFAVASGLSADPAVRAFLLRQMGD